MNRFAGLIDALLFMPARNGKLRLLTDYFASAPDPDRGWALAAIVGDLSFAAAKPALVRTLVMERVDPTLFGWSYDFVGDLAETVALIWPERPGVNRPPPALTEVVEALSSAKRAEVPRLLEEWLDTLDATGRWALLKLITGALRIGVSARLAKSALAEWGAANGVAVGDAPVSADDIEEVWHGLAPPYGPLFAWLSGAGPRPEASAGGGFRPVMLAHPLEEEDIKALDASAYRAEWKWDGVRVQLVARTLGESRLYTRTGDDIGAAFPEVVERARFDAVLDGELLVGEPLVGTDGHVRPFNDLQQRLNRKRPTAKLLAEFPAFVRVYDLLVEAGEDLRPLPFDERRRRLEAWVERVRPPGLDLSPLVPFDGWDDLAEKRASARTEAIEGLMLKRGDSAYVPGRPKGPWFKWKRGPLTADCVLMYAQRGHGKRSSYYSDFTFGAWTADPSDGGELVPVGKAYFGFTDAELAELDRWIRNNTVNRFGPVREVARALVLEVAFDSVQPSTRHKSGLAMRFPRVARIRWDKPAGEADRVVTLKRMVAG